MHTWHTLMGVRVRLASPEVIRAWSMGEVKTPTTLNYLTNKPEPGGLLCERIFGPMHDWTCACGKYRHARTPGFICEQCGVTIAPSRVRRERMGHIALAVPIVHPWFARGIPNVLATLLNLSPRHLAAVLAYTGYLVVSLNEAARDEVLHASRDASAVKQAMGAIDEVENASLRCLATLTVGTFLTEQQYAALRCFDDACFQALTGAEAIRRCLMVLDLDALAASLHETLHAESHVQRRHAIKRLQVVEACRTSGVNPAWMVMDVLPVLPPDLRPLIHLSGGRFASADLNVLYARVLQRNARVTRALAQRAPLVIQHYEQRLLQDACDALFDNQHSSHPLLGRQRHPLKSLTHLLTGKQGRFRRNLLGKRVDYSGRSVICVGVDLRVHECGLPKKMALELFKPFVIRKLLDRHLARSPRHAKRLVERRDAVVWDQLAECLHEKVVLLNRAPTLHRLSIQAFEATLVEGDAIRLHPLVCAAFNADFDGDQMAVHLPLSDEAQDEARRLLLSTRNLRSPATGEPTMTLSQEMVLGCYYLTEMRAENTQTRRVYTDANEACLAYEQGVIALHTPIIVRLADTHVYDAPPPVLPGNPPRGRIETTVGRVLFNDALPETLRYRNYPMTKEGLKHLIAESLACLGEEATAQLADALKRLGYRFATKSGISFALSDMQEPPDKQQMVAQGQAEAQAIQYEYQQGHITAVERDQRTIAVWTARTEQISQRLLALLDPYGTLATIVKSGATKAKFQQIRQLSGIRGLLADPSGRIIPIPVLGNYLHGLTTWEVFIAASGARKGFMDRSLNTAQSGYLTRKLVEVGMEVWTTQADCGSREGWRLTQEESQALGLPDFSSRVLGRILVEPVAGLATGTLLDEPQVHHLLAEGVSAVCVRSPFTCRADYGICCHCYGRDLATGQLVQRGVAVGILAGQSIGEPGTQLTMRTFHSGGIANAQGDMTQGLPRVQELFEAYSPKQAALLAQRDGVVRFVRHEQTGHTCLHLLERDAAETLPTDAPTYNLAPGQSWLVTEGQGVAIGTPLTTGQCHPKHLLALQGREAVAHYLVNEVQRVYRATGVFINEKHVEVIVRQMLRYVQITDPGDTALLPGTLLDRFQWLATTASLLAEGGTPALAHPVLLGLTRAALQTASWIAAASFQETSRVLTHAALRGQVDPLRGYKERVVLGLRLPLPDA